jgi:hypothetical protein
MLKSKKGSKSSVYTIVTVLAITVLLVGLGILVWQLFFRYECENGNCARKMFGAYGSSDCDGKCTPKVDVRYDCNDNGECVRKTSGNYRSSDCDRKCTTKVNVTASEPVFEKVTAGTRPWVIPTYYWATVTDSKNYCQRILDSGYCDPKYTWLAIPKVYSQSRTNPSFKFTIQNPSTLKNTDGLWLTIVRSLDSRFDPTKPGKIKHDVTAYDITNKTEITHTDTDNPNKYTVPKITVSYTKPIAINLPDKPGTPAKRTEGYVYGEFPWNFNPKNPPTISGPTPTPTPTDQNTLPVYYKPYMKDADGNNIPGKMYKLPPTYGTTPTFLFDQDPTPGFTMYMKRISKPIDAGTEWRAPTDDDEAWKTAEQLENIKLQDLSIITSYNENLSPQKITVKKAWQDTKNPFKVPDPPNIELSYECPIDVPLTDANCSKYYNDKKVSLGVPWRKGKEASYRTDRTGNYVPEGHNIAYATKYGYTTSSKPAVITENPTNRVVKINHTPGTYPTEYGMRPIIACNDCGYKPSDLDHPPELVLSPDSMNNPIYLTGDGEDNPWNSNRNRPAVFDTTCEFSDGTDCINQKCDLGAEDNPVLYVSNSNCMGDANRRYAFLSKKDCIDKCGKEKCAPNPYTYKMVKGEDTCKLGKNVWGYSVNSKPFMVGDINNAPSNPEWFDLFVKSSS